MIRPVATIALGVATASVAYLAIATAATAAFARRRVRRSSASPSISVLKPVYGWEPQLERNLATFCEQRYPDFEVLLCLHSGDAAGGAAAERVARAFPNVARVLIGDADGVRNPKVANLLKGEAAARGAIVVIADSDVGVGPSYLRAIAADFEDPKVGAVSSLYRGVACGNWVSRLAATYASGQFAPSVLVATTFARMRFCLGASLAVRADVLRAFGGMRRCGDAIADDHCLGRLVSNAGYDVRLSRYVVATAACETTIGQLWAHELRWARTNLSLAPLGYAGSFVTFGVPIAMLALAISKNARIGIPIVLAAAGFRVTLLRLCAHALDERPPAPLWSIPLRDCLGLAIWAASFAMRTVRWRGRDVTVDIGGRLR